MKLASYIHDGRATFGIVADSGLIDIPKRAGGTTDLGAALKEPEGIGAFAAYASEKSDCAITDVTFLPVIPNPSKTICVGLNYRDHAAETGMDLPDHPTLFIRYADAQVGHGEALVRPRVSHRFDYEGELAAIIGKAARHVEKSAALDYVAGYTCFNDGSVRDWQGHTSQFTPGKNFVKTGSMGPWMVTRDEIADVAALSLTTRFNGETVQQASTGNMIFDLPSLIEYITTFTELSPGDVIATGTPAGVGYRRTPRLYMKAGDVVEIEIEGIGTLSNPVIDEA